MEISIEQRLLGLDLVLFLFNYFINSLIAGNLILRCCSVWTLERVDEIKHFFFIVYIWLFSIQILFYFPLSIFDFVRYMHRLMREYNGQ